MIEDARIRLLNDRQPAAGDYVLYWMQQSQRAAGNPALEYAIGAANERELPVVVGFGLMDAYPEANRRHYAFMLQGLREVERSLAERGIGFVIRRGPPDEVALALAGKAALVVCDRGYLRHQKRWRARGRRGCALPRGPGRGRRGRPGRGSLGQGMSIAARTLRPKLHRVWDAYLSSRRRDRGRARSGTLGLRLGESTSSDVARRALGRLDLDGERRAACAAFGAAPAQRASASRASWRDARRLCTRAAASPAACQCSLLSPYLHFGQISPVEIALRGARRRTGRATTAASYLEELIVRRELSMNFVEFDERYDRYDCLPDWAQTTLRAHRGDRREHIYSAGAARARRDPRPLLERGDARDGPHRLHAQLHAHVLGQEDPRVVADARAAPSPRPCGSTTATSSTGATPILTPTSAWTFGLHDRPWPERADLRQGALHERQGPRAQVRHEVLPLRGRALGGAGERRGVAHLRVARAISGK